MENSPFNGSQTKRVSMIDEVNESLRIKKSGSAITIVKVDESQVT